VKNLYVDELRFVSSNFKLMHGASGRAKKVQMKGQITNKYLILYTI
jgi:hypothetical protein